MDNRVRSFPMIVLEAHTADMLSKYHESSNTPSRPVCRDTGARQEIGSLLKVCLFILTNELQFQRKMLFYFSK